MNITLTLTEATELVRQALKIPSHQSLVLSISTETHPLAIALRQAVTEFPFYLTNQKIASIKRFRELAPQVLSEDYSGQPRMVSSVGLADAKWSKIWLLPLTISTNTVRLRSKI